MSEALLNNTSHLILGMLASAPKSGYDIKALADHSTRFFWQISYGQIYPELKRLAAAGMAELEPDPVGGRARNRYRITELGRRALVDWIASPTGSFEMRDEILLKLFFADSAGEPAALELVRAMKTRHQAALAQLQEIEVDARRGGRCTLRVLRAGLKLHRAYVDVCEDLEREMQPAST